MINITDRGPLGYARRVVAGVCLAFPHVLLCAEPSTSEGSAVRQRDHRWRLEPLPYAAIAQRAGQSPFPYRVLHGARLRQLLVESLPFNDEDAEESPEPGNNLKHYA